ncbi:hypothetical protein E2C01_018317 [Portunus trituberculatus]|uniref:Uncharacterized protein n=1 Tax=Portunus trituberculatus TaxID=210409 RepID=A0A5B7DU71_PORTR|nr:hypothetical protein [Portunus trituberculatus]
MSSPSHYASINKQAFQHIEYHALLAPDAAAVHPLWRFILCYSGQGYKVSVDLRIQ